MKILTNFLSKCSSRAVIVFAAIALLFGGFLGVAAAAPTEQPGPTPESTLVGERTEQATPDKNQTPGSLAAISHRHLWCGISGDFRLNLTGLGAFDGQPVAVTISEAGTSGSEVIGAARMRVNNVSVWAGTVTAWVSVEWASPLCVWVHYVAI
ncbi:hypothetical protein [Actinophytocola sp.]|uniref:hypothetical protein n=1 Tax=Actinophytocola sp. TaxID=1872138 RepID=UPI002ED24DE7